MGCGENAEGIAPLIVAAAFTIGVVVGAGASCLVWIRSRCRAQGALVVPAS